MADEALENEDEGMMSLADLAGLDISEIEEIRSQRVPGGAYVFKGKGAKLSDMTNKDGEKRFVVNVQLEVVEVQAIVEKGYKPEEVLGMTHNERFFIVPAEAEKGIGRIRAWYTDVGLDSSGPLGGRVEDGVAPGVVDRIVDHLFPAKIVTNQANGETYSKIRLPKKKAA